jgi:hypothetical protein
MIWLEPVPIFLITLYYVFGGNDGNTMHSSSISSLENDGKIQLIVHSRPVCRNRYWLSLSKGRRKTKNDPSQQDAWMTPLCTRYRYSLCSFTPLYFVDRVEILADKKSFGRPKDSDRTGTVCTWYRYRYPGHSS